MERYRSVANKKFQGPRGNLFIHEWGRFGIVNFNGMGKTET